MPVWAALALVGAAYLLRSIVIRGGDFSLDTSDVIAGVVVAVALALVVLIRRREGDTDDTVENGDSRQP